MIDAVYVLALDKRKDFIPPLEKQVNDILGLPLNKFWCGGGADPLIKYDHIDIPKEECAQFLERPAEHSMRGHANAFLCHKKMLFRASYYERVLFLEDDAYFIEGRWKSLSEFGKKQIHEDNYDALYLGWQGREHPNDSDDMDVAEEYYKLTGQGRIDSCKIGGPKISGLHGIVMTQPLMEYLVNVYKGPLDSYLNSHWALDCFNMFYIRPKIIGSKACFSYCEQKWQDRSLLE